jgi:RimJ/RimL family protein N-acetyltransferase
MVIITRRFLLRDFTEADRTAFRAYHGDPRYLALYGPDEAGSGHADMLLQTFEKWSREQPRRNYQLAVVRRKQPQTLVGCCGLRGVGSEPGGGRAELGVELAPEHWGSYGYAIEVVRVLIDFGFAELGLDEITGVTTSANAPVARVAAWFGATEIEARPGPAWLRERGWHEVVWRVARARWELGGTPDNATYS